MLASAMIRLTQYASQKEYIFMTILVIDNNRGDRHLLDYCALIAELVDTG